MRPIRFSEEEGMPSLSIAALWCLVKYGHALRRLSQSGGLLQPGSTRPSLKAIRNSNLVVGMNTSTSRQQFSGIFAREFSLLLLIEQVLYSLRTLFLLAYSYLFLLTYLF